MRMCQEYSCSHLCKLFIKINGLAGASVGIRDMRSSKDKKISPIHTFLAFYPRVQFIIVVHDILPNLLLKIFASTFLLLVFPY